MRTRSQERNKNSLEMRPPKTRQISPSSRGQKRKIKSEEMTIDRTSLKASRCRKQVQAAAESDSHIEETAMDMEHIKPETTEEELLDNDSDHINKLSLEILCRVMKSLSLFDVVKLEHLCRRLHQAVSMHLRLLTELDFTEGKIYGWMPDVFTDKTFGKFLPRCKEVIYISGLNPQCITKRRNPDQSRLSIPGVISALSSCNKLHYVETCDIFLLEAILAHLPRVSIKRFKNRNGTFPIPHVNRFELTRNPQITYLHLSGVTIPELPRMDYLKYLHLQWVRLSLPHPFREFSVPHLRSFVMSSCGGPSNALSYVPLITALAAAPNLSRLELVRVPFLGGLIQHVVEDNWRMGAFRQLTKITFGACRHALEVDLGYLAITCAQRLVELCVQPSLTKDSFFASLSMAEAPFPSFETLKLGHVDDFPQRGTWTNQELVAHGLADYMESPSMITDLGMQSVGRVFPECRSLSIYNCPHLHMPLVWFSPEQRNWRRLKELHLFRCHAKLLNEFRKVIPQLTSLESLILEQMFREPPKGCSRVGLSAGTGLGVSSALIQNTQHEVANQDLVNNNAPGPAANQQGPLNQPLLQPQPPPVIDEDEDDDIHEDMEVEALLEQGPVNQFAADAGPANQILDVDAAGNNNNDVAAGPANQNPPNNNNGNGAAPANNVFVGNNLANPGEAEGAVPANQNEAAAGANPAVGNELAGAQQPNVVLQKPLDAQNNDDGETDSDEEVSLNNIICTCGQRSNDYVSDAAPRGASKSRSRPKSDGASGSADGSLECKAGCSRLCRNSQNRELRRSSRIINSHGRSSDSKPLVKGKGKTSKKFTPKKSKLNKQVNQYCQATCEEIRETTKKAKEKEEAARQSTRTRSRRLNSSGPQPSTSQASSGGGCGSETQSSGSSLLLSSPLAKRARLRKSNMVDKSTSTSDPVIEEDQIQILTIRSNSLVNLTLREVGITDLMLHECPRLQMVNGSSCRVLRDVLIKNAPRLNRISFIQCPKLRNEDLVDEVSMQPAERNRLITLRPIWLRPPAGVLSYNVVFDRYSKYNPRNLEAELFRSAMCNYHLCIIHDYTSKPELTLQNRMRATAWPDLFTNIHFELIRNHGFKEAETRSELGAKQKYPWGRSIYRMHGRSQAPEMLTDGTLSVANSWEIMTDLPWLQALASSPALGLGDKTSPNMEGKSGLYDLNAMGHRDTLDVIDLIWDVIAEAHESDMRLYLSTLLVYVNMCDIDSHVKQDCYV